MLYFLKPQSANGRIIVWKTSLKMIADKPLTGFGKGGFAANYMYYQAEYMKSSASSREKRLAGSTHMAFNEPLRITVEYGFIGLFIYVIFVIWILYPPKRQNFVIIISKSLLAGIIMWGMFAYPDMVFPVCVLWVIGIICILNKKTEKTYIIFIHNKCFQTVATVIYCCIIVFLVGKLEIKWQSYHGLYEGIKIHHSHNISKYAGYLAQYKEEMQDDIGFLYLYCQIVKAAHIDMEFLNTVLLLERCFPTSNLFMIKGDYLKEKGLWSDAEEDYKLAVNMEPSLQSPRARLAILYNEMGRKKEALIIVREILTEDIKIYSFDTFKLHRDLKRIFEGQLK